MTTIQLIKILQDSLKSMGNMEVGIFDPIDGSFKEVMLQKANNTTVFSGDSGMEECVPYPVLELTTKE